MSLGRNFTLNALGATALLALAGTASASQFSFASDDDSSFPTLSGAAGAGGTFRIRNGRTPTFTPVTLDVDDDNGAQPTAHLPVGLVIDLTATHVASTPIGSAFSHVYSITGSYAFVHPSTGVPLLQVQINPGSSNLTISGAASSWGSAGSIFGSDAAAGGANGVNYTDTGFAAYMSSLGFNPTLYGLSGFAMEDFAFTMTNANAGGGSVALDSISHLPTTAWSSEASHSGHSLVPAPGAAGLLGAAAVAGTRRRRR